MPNPAPDQHDVPLGTVLESNEEIERVRKAIRSQKEAIQTSSTESVFCPTVRPPIAILAVLDDGESSGELIRIRDEQFIVGRTEGDLRLPFDELLSSRHLAINRQIVQGAWRWVITDLQSRNGVFFRVSKAPLSHNTEFLIGGGCYKFQIVQQTCPDTQGWNGINSAPPGTRAFQGDLQPGTATITELLRGGIGSRQTLVKDSYRIGSDVQCDIVRNQDPFTRSEHATLTRSDRGTWVIQNNSTKNGVWIRLPQIGISSGGTCEFQAGEQRFKLSFGTKK